jgi:hypothetical protein
MSGMVSETAHLRDTEKTPAQDALKKFDRDPSGSRFFVGTARAFRSPSRLDLHDCRWRMSVRIDPVR